MSCQRGESPSTTPGSGLGRREAVNRPRNGVQAPLPLLAGSLDRTIAANASLIIATAGPQTPPLKAGAGQLAATNGVNGFEILRHATTAQEVVVPLESRKAGSYVLTFDNRTARC